MIPFEPRPAPEVIEGDARSYLARARWNVSQSWRGDSQLLKADLEEAIRLDPDAWEPWVMLAEVFITDAAQQLRCYNEAIERKADASVSMRRGHCLHWLRRYAEAENDYSVVLAAAPNDSIARRYRADVRVQLRDIEGAIADTSAPGSQYGEHYLCEIQGRLLWIRGDLKAAFETLSFPIRHIDSAERFRIWAHLCQVSRGVLSPMPEDPLIPSPARGQRGAAVPNRVGYQTVGEDGSVQPQLWIWDVLTELFLDRIEPEDVLTAASAELALSDAWRPPARPEGRSIAEFSLPSRIWRSEVQFYCGMWYLSKRNVDAARAALKDAARDDHSESLERWAAAAQLERLDELLSRSGPVPRLTRDGLSAASPVARFVALKLDVPGFYPTPSGPRLDLQRQGLGDAGLRSLLERSNTRYLTRLDLQVNGISTAGMAAFRESSNIVNLRSLDLSDNPIGDIGLETLFRSSALLSLTDVNLSNTELTDKSFDLLARQPHVPLERVVLGDTPVDMPIWCRMAERYKAGLHARGAFNTPYRPPFKGSKLIQFCFRPVAEPPQPSIWPDYDRESTPLTPSTIQMELSDYLAYRWTQATNLSSGYKGAARAAGALEEMRALESRYAAVISDTVVEYRDEGFTLIAGGVSPLRVFCAACAGHRRQSGAEFLKRHLGLCTEYVCPMGHVLYRSRSIP